MFIIVDHDSYCNSINVMDAYSCIPKVDLSAWNSSWILEGQKTFIYPSTGKEIAKEFVLSYWNSAVFAVLLLTLV
ncbi:MAG: hypothetical protein QMB11_11740 [Nonlabens sp.]|jgi:hypothetical protein|uniref:hypothetical protein n=1 Tax=Nonlabens sp. TaxID=1888209 RepID=UPI0035A6F418